MTDLLLPHHLDQLVSGSGISPDIVTARGYRSIHGPESYSELKALGFNKVQCRLAPGLLVPILGVDGQPVLYQFRPDTPRQNKEGKPIKYETPAKAGMRLDMGVGQRELLKKPDVSLWITEGIKKDDALRTHGLCTIGLLGVYNFKGKNPYGGITFLNDWDDVALNGRQVRIVFDNDTMRKPQVYGALKHLTERLQRRMAHIKAVYLPTEGGEKVGVDDYLRTHPLQDLEGLIEQPRPIPQAASPIMELLDEVPPQITRPLALIHDHTYAATWLPVRLTRTEILDKKSGVVTPLDPPIVTTTRLLFIIRDDGTLFGDVVDKSVLPLKALELELHLPEIPPPEKLWSSSGVKRYRVGYRPEPKDVFVRLCAVISRFIDFARSLGNQDTMCELVACYILSTWFLDAFNVIGFLWPNGERGSGKTQLLNLVAELGYLGQMILSGGSYATLRDLADYGATLAFDEAEMLSDPKQTDPDKRAMLLAGNRRGSTVTVKELAADKVWRTRYVNTFCPRLFSAIRLPDQVLASRSIVVPLIRTPDRERANADPLDYSVWPHDRRDLLDDLWALALCHMSNLRHYETQVNEVATLVGRNLEPWRPLLSVAKWLDDQGVTGLWGRMEQLSQDYQHDRPDLESADLTIIVIKALSRFVEPANSKPHGTNDTNGTSGTIEEGAYWDIKSAELKDMVVTLIKELEISMDIEKISTDRVGRVLGRMRFRRTPQDKKKGPRQWRISEGEVARWVAAYGLPPLKDDQVSAASADDSPLIINLQESSTNPQHTSAASVISAASAAMSEPFSLDRCPTCGGTEWETWMNGRVICSACLRGQGG